MCYLLPTFLYNTQLMKPYQINKHTLSTTRCISLNIGNSVFGFNGYPSHLDPIVINLPRFLSFIGNMEKIWASWTNRWVKTKLRDTIYRVMIFTTASQPYGAFHELSHEKNKHIVNSLTIAVTYCQLTDNTCQFVQKTLIFSTFPINDGVRGRLIRLY